MSYPSAIPMKAPTEAAANAKPSYTLSQHKSSEGAKYPFKWTALGLAVVCTSFWLVIAWLL
jgi:hypothetical protein